MKTLAEHIAERLRRIFPSEEKVGLHEPKLGKKESENVQACLDSTFVSSVGKFVDLFEQRLSEYTGAGHVVAVVNGTCALQIALLLVEVKPGEEVVVPSLTFAATANAVRHVGAIPHFTDCNGKTPGMDAEALEDWLKHISEPSSSGIRNRETGRKISCVVPVHVFGHPCDMENLSRIASDFGLEMVEDSTEALGSFYQGRHMGTFGKVGTLSFNGNKIVTTGGGGAVLTDDEKLAKRGKHLTTTAKIPHPWEYVHDAIGYNYRLPNLNAALGCAQLERLPGLLASKRSLFDRYREIFSDLPAVEIMREPAGCRSNYWLQALRLGDEAIENRDDILEAANRAGFAIRPVWKPLHDQKPFLEFPRSPLPFAEKAGKSVINLPSSC